MKLPDFINFEPFNSLRHSMKAELINKVIFTHNIERLTIADLEMIEGKGLEIDINQIIELEDGTLAYKDSRVLLHIRDVTLYHQKDDNEALPRFHVANCRTLKTMKENNRYERYVVSTRRDGKFEINFIRKFRKHENKPSELKVCWNCLNYISYKRFSYLTSIERKNIQNLFSTDEYFSSYPRDWIITKPTYNDTNAPINDYADDFPKVSANYKQEKSWTCQECKVDLSKKEYKKYLHTHHLNGQKWDNSEKNIISLCVYCHAQQPMHAHVCSTNHYKEFIKIYNILKQG